MRYRIIRYLEYGEGDNEKPVFECQCQRFFLIPLSRWHQLYDNTEGHKKMKFNSLRKAKEAMMNYFLRDVSLEYSKNPQSEFPTMKRFCHYVDTDFIEFSLLDY